jgi:hypothetical protein
MQVYVHEVRKCRHICRRMSTEGKLIDVSVRSCMIIRII